MTTPSTAAGTDHDAGKRHGETSRAASRWRVVLLVWLGVLVVAGLLTGTRPASLGELEGGLRSGEVTELHVVGTLERGAVGRAYPEIEWHDGLQPRYTVAQQVREDAGTQFFGDSDAPVVSNDLAAQLTSWTPAGDLRLTSEDFRRGWQGELYGWKVPSWVSLTCLLWGATAFFTLLWGPEPRWATRWAWFWLLWGSAGLAMVPYVVFGLPRAGQPSSPTGRPLGGGAAFLVSLFLPPGAAA